MKEGKKKEALLITLAALAGIIAVTIAVTVIMSSRGGARFSISDVPYPYTWVEKEDGTVALTLDAGDVTDGAWRFESTTGGSVRVDVGETRRAKTAVTLTPVEEGREDVSFSLMAGEERLAELSLTVAVGRTESKYAATVTDHRERALQGLVRGGEETEHPFTARGVDGGLTILIEGSGEMTEDDAAWEAASSDSLVAYVSAVDNTADNVSVQLEARANGSAEVTVFNRSLIYVFTVEVKSGEMRLTASRTETPDEEGAEVPEADTAEAP